MSNLETCPDYLDNIPEPDQGYLDAISGGFDDSLYNSEPVIIQNSPVQSIGLLPKVQSTGQHKSTRPQNLAVYKKDGFDILSLADSELTAIASACEIDWQALKPLINRNQTEYKKGIELNKKARGSVIAYVHFKTTHGGQEYPHITFKTFKNGEVKEIFNGYEFARDTGLFDTKPLTDSELKAIQAKRAERDQQQAKKAELAKQQQENTQEQTIKRFNDFQKLFDNLPLLTDTQKPI